MSRDGNEKFTTKITVTQLVESSVFIFVKNVGSENAGYYVLPLINRISV